jgi:DNA-binding response OmpR family regulator
MSRVLVLDDDAGVLVAAARFLELAGFEVLTCGGPFHPLAALLQPLPDLVLLDVNMPDLPGDELFQLIRQQPGGAALPIALFSSNDEAELRRLARALGACGYVPKSSLGPGLAAKVRRLMPTPPD